MKKPAKIAGIVVAVLVALVAALAGIAKLLITPERVKATVISAAERSLHRPVKLGDIQISIFSRIAVKDLTVLEKDGSTPFVSTQQMLLRYQFWPLFSRRVVVDEIALERPTIRVVRLPDGSFNYSDIIAKKEAPQQPKEKKKEELDLLVSQIKVTDGAVSFEDRAVKSGPPVTYRVSALEISAKDISKEAQFPFEIKGRIPGLAVEISGKAADVAAKASIDATVRLRDGDFGKLIAGLPPALAAKARPYHLSGSFSGEMHAAGLAATPKELFKGGEVDLKELDFTASGQRLMLKGKLNVKADSVSSRDLVLSMGENMLHISFTAGNLMGKPITLASVISADNFNLDPLLKKGAAPAAPSPTTGAAKPEPGPLHLPLRATGRMELARTAYKGLPITGLRLRYRLEENVLTVEELKGNAAQGSFTESGRVDLRVKGFRYSSRVSVRGMQADPLLRAFAPKAVGTLYGTIAANADVAGSGTETVAMKKNLSGHGDFNITEGRITGSKLAQGLAQYINVGELRDIRFNSFAGTFQIANGQLHLDSGVSGRDVQLTPKGRVGLVDDSVELSLLTKLSPALTGKVAGGGVGKYVTDEKGWGIVPLKVAGTLSSPKFRIDSAVVREQLGGKARQKIEQTLDEKVFKKKEGEQQRPERELLEKGLKGIFGK